MINGAESDVATVIETVMRDRAFIVDSLLEHFHRIGALVREMLHPVFRVARALPGISNRSKPRAARTGRILHSCRARDQTNSSRAEEIAAEVREVLTEVRRAADDFERMTGRTLRICDETAAVRELVEMREFLRWLVRGGLSFSAIVTITSVSQWRSRALVELDSGLGILGDFAGRGSLPRVRSTNSADGELRLLFDGPPARYHQDHVESHVHRRRAMDSIMIRRTAPNGKVSGFDRLVGLFTSKAFAEEPSTFRSCGPS